ncbi:type IV secretory system conjugative DNA transfer family protein, partial [Helicobacter saguini]
MEQKRTPLQQLVRGSIIIFTSILASVLIYFGTSAWIFEIPIWNISELLEHGYIVFTNLGNPYLKLKAYYPIAYASIPYICCIVYWLLDNNSIKNSYGNARFATTKDFKEMGLNLESKGVQFACMIKGKKRIPISTQKPLAILIVAPAGTGKTASVALPNLFSLPNSCFVLDIKGELLEKSAGFRQKNFKNEILVFSPLDKRNSMYFNPFDNTIIKDFDFVEMMQLADQIAGTIFVGEKGKENDHWVVSAKTLFTFFALYSMQKYKNATLGELSQAPKKDYYDELQGDFKKKVSREATFHKKTGERLTEEEVSIYQYPNDLETKLEKDPDQISEIWKTWLTQVSEDTTLDDFVRNQARAYQSAAETEFASIKSTYDTFMKVFANPKVAEATSKMSFDYEDLREKKITVYVVIQTQDMDILAPLVRILVESMFKKLMFNENSNPDKFIYFILDEFIRFGKMSFLLEAPALCRSYGLVPLYITQSYEQIKKYYGDDDLKILRANAAFQVVFRMNSFDDAKTLSDMIGDYTRKKLSTSKDSMAVLKKNNSISEEGYKLVTPQDILSSPDGQVFVLVG